MITPAQFVLAAHFARAADADEGGPVEEPTAPAQFQASDWSVSNDATGGSITILVSSLPSDGGSPITALEYRIDAGSWISLDAVTAGSYHVTGLTDGVAISVALRAVNAIGAGTASSTKSVTPSTAATAPSRFASGDWSVSDDTTGGSITLTIIALPSNGGSAITALQYQMNGGAWTSLGSTAIGSYKIAGLTNGTSYSVAVRAVNAIGNGTASATKTVTPTIEITGSSLLLSSIDELDPAETLLLSGDMTDGDDQLVLSGDQQ